MKAIHNTNSETRIEKFDLQNRGLNTISNINSDNAFRLAGCFLGVWFSSQIIDSYKFAHEYELNDSDYMVLDSLDELESYMQEEIQKIEYVTAYELFKNTEKLIDLVSRVRENILSQGYTGISITNDDEFDCESLIALDLDTINQ